MTNRHELKESLKRLELPTAERLREVPKDSGLPVIQLVKDGARAMTWSQSDCFVHVLETGFSIRLFHIKYQYVNFGEIIVRPREGKGREPILQ